MGINLRGIRDKNVRRSSNSKQDSEVGLAASIFNFMKQGCLCTTTSTTEKRRKKQFHPQEKKRPLLKNTGIELVTLEQWILASPCLHVGNDQGDHQFQLSKQASKRIHPSFDRANQEGSLSKSSSLKFDQVDKKEVKDSSFTQSGKLKKVSFRLPEVVDVFILDSPE